MKNIFVLLASMLLCSSIQADHQALKQAVATVRGHAIEHDVSAADVAALEALAELAEGIQAEELSSELKKDLAEIETWAAQADDMQLRNKLNKVFNSLRVIGLLEVESLAVYSNVSIGGDLMVEGTIHFPGEGPWVLKTGDTMTGDLVLANQSAVQFSEQAVNGTDTITLQAPASVPASYTLTLPSNSGTASYVLSTDGSGKTSWQAVSAVGATGITMLNTLISSTQIFATGTAGTAFNIVSAINTHTFNIPAASTSGVTGGVISNTDYSHFQSAYTAAVVNATTAGTPNTLVLRDGSGNITLGSSNSVTLAAPASGGAQTIHLPVGAGSNGNVLTTNGAGVTNWQPVSGIGAITSLNGLTASAQLLAVGTAGTALNIVPAGSTNTFNLPPASTSGVTGGVISNTDYSHFQSAYTAAVVNATTAGTANTLVLRNGSGNITFGASNSVTLAAPASGGAETITLPVGAGSNGYVLTTNGAGTTSWSPVSGSSGVSSITGNTGVATSGAVTLSGSQGGKTVVFNSTSSTAMALRLSDSNFNVALGLAAGNALTSGTNNVIVGSAAGIQLSSGSFNTLVGYAAGPGGALMTGSSNVALGNLAGGALTTGSNNIFIGASAATATGSGNIVVGTTYQGVPAAGDTDWLLLGSGPTNAQATSSKTRITGAFFAGTTGTQPGVALSIGDDGSLGTVTSSRRFKQDIVDMADDSSVLMKLRPVTFTYKHRPGKEYGLIAEEVNECIPEMVLTDKNGEPFTVRYDILPAMLLNEIQKLHHQVQELTQHMAELTGSVGAVATSS